MSNKKTFNVIDWQVRQSIRVLSRIFVFANSLLQEGQAAPSMTRAIHLGHICDDVSHVRHVTCIKI